MSDQLRGFGPAVQATGEPLALGMQTLWLTGHVLPVGARLWVRHEFQCTEDKPVEVIYTFMLPRDATLRRFRVTGEGFSVDSKLQPVEEARKTYEAGIEAGSLSTLAQNYQDGLVTLSVGNVRPGEKVTVLLEVLAGVELHDGGLRLRFPFTLAPSYHARARCIESEPGIGELDLPEEEFGDLILPRFLKNASNLHQVGFDMDLRIDGLQEVSSPSHSIRVGVGEKNGARVSLSRASDVPNRDLVLDAKIRLDKPEVIGGIDDNEKGHFSVLVPSTLFGKPSQGPRKVLILLDRSGSMNGAPIVQARSAIAACLSTLTADDEFGLLAFDNSVETFRPQLVKANTDARKAAREFLNAINARGGTELAMGLTAAADLLRSHGNENTNAEVFVITDGQVLGTNEVLEAARRTGARIHCLGIGSASQDQFLSQLSTQTGGVSRFLTPREAVDCAALELFASISAPVAQNVKVSVGEGLRARPKAPTNVFSGTPILVLAESDTKQGSQLQLHWQGAEGVQSLDVNLRPVRSPIAHTLRLLQGSRLIADAESHLVGLTRSADEKLANKRYRSLLVQLSSEFELASSQMALVAVAKRADDQAGTVPKTMIVGVGMPEDVEFGTYFPLRFASRMSLQSFVGVSRASASGRICRVFGSPDHLSEMVFGAEDSQDLSAYDLVPNENRLALDLVAALESDGGMPGQGWEERMTNSLVVLLFLLQNGSTPDDGPFRVHIRKLLAYLTKVLAEEPRPLYTKLEDVINRAHHQWQPRDNRWSELARIVLDTGTIDPVRVRHELSQL
jgi:Mg-chelatase subunit ChlD